MMYDISEYINPQNPLYIKGCIAIKKKDAAKLDDVLNHPDFDCSSYEARGLLFCAAENINIDAFHKLGDVNVVLFDPLKILKQRPHILSQEIDATDVYLIQDTTPLHTLLKKMNLRFCENLNLEEHFDSLDIERTLNTYSFKDKGTPLDILWKKHISACQFLKQQAQRNNECITQLPTDFLNFYAYTLSYLPDITAPTLVEEPLLYQRAIQENDILTLHAVSDYTVYCLNTVGYKFSQKEYELLYKLAEPEQAEKMQKGFEEPIVQRTTFFNKTKLFFDRIFSRQKD